MSPLLVAPSGLPVNNELYYCHYSPDYRHIPSPCLLVKSALLYKNVFSLQYVQGNVPIIITAPHGGTIEPSEIADRIDGCPTSSGCVYEKDPVRLY